MEYLIIILIFAFLFAFLTKQTMKNKGYSDDESRYWFWYGFLFGIIAFLIALSKPENRHISDYSSSDTIDFLQGKNAINQGWKCKRCNTMNPSYTGTCKCGMTKEENEQSSYNARNNIASSSITKPNISPNNQTLSEADKVDALMKYKSLLDSGVITLDEFNRKKETLLK